MRVCVCACVCACVRVCVRVCVRACDGRVCFQLPLLYKATGNDESAVTGPMLTDIKSRYR